MSLKSGNNANIVNLRDGMIDPALSTPLYVSATSFSVAGDVTGFIRAGRGVRLTFASSGEKVCLITGVSYSAANNITTITVSGESLVNEVVTKAEVSFSDGEATKNYVDTHGFIDRGDTAAYDFGIGDLTTDGTYRDLDCSSIVPAGAKAILFRVAIKDNAASSSFELRKNGNSNNINLLKVYTQVANVYNFVDGIVACDSDRKVEYKASNLTFTTLSIVVKGWYL